jgi:hypothetical protein
VSPLHPTGGSTDLVIRYVPNSLDGGPKLTGALELTSDYPDNIRDYLDERGVTRVTLDADGNGSLVAIPVSWIADGKPLEMSGRVLKLLHRGSR